MGEDFFRGEMATLLEYSGLLRQKRIPEAEEEVKQALLEEKSMVARINKIKEIDRRFENMDANQIKSLSEIKIKEIETEHPAIKKLSFFNYFFSMRKILVRYCQEYAVITPGFLGLKFYISNESLSLLDEIRNNSYKQILPVLQKILENGWKVLDPSIYNVFYYLYSFLNTFLKRFVLDKKDILKNYDFVEAFSKDFFTLMSNKRYLQEIREGIYIFYGNKENEEMVNFILFVEGLLNKSKKFSFLNYVLMIYSVYYRQPVSLEKMLETKELDRIPNTKYLINERVKFIFKDYLEKVKKKEELVEKKMYYLQHIWDEQPSVVEDFIRMNGNPKFKMEFITADLMRSLADFLKAFLPYIKPIFLAELTLVKDGSIEKTAIFRMLWESSVNKLDEVSQEISYSNETFKYFFITLSKYEKYLEQGRHLQSEKDEKLCALVSKCADILYDLYEILVKILYNDYKLTNMENKEFIFDKLRTRNRPMSESEDERFLPFSDYRVKEYNDDIVFNILTQIATVTGTFLYILGSSKIKEKLKEKQALVDESKRNIENIMRIS